MAMVLRRGGFGRGIAGSRRGGLLGTAARTAVVAGTATAVSGRVARRQQARAAAKAEQAELAELGRAAVTQAPAPAAGPAAAGPPAKDDVIDLLKDLVVLRDQGVLDDAEFAAQKARILAG